MGNKGKSLNDKYEKFAQEYSKDFNGTRAAIAAGYSEKTAASKASQLLTIVNIQERVAELKKKHAEKTEITAEWLTKRFKEVSDTADKESDVLKALENLGKRIGYYEEHNDQKKPDLKATIKFTK